MFHGVRNKLVCSKKFSKNAFTAPFQQGVMSRTSPRSHAMNFIEPPKLEKRFNIQESNLKQMYVNGQGARHSNVTKSLSDLSYFENSTSVQSRFLFKKSVLFLTRD